MSLYSTQVQISDGCKSAPISGYRLREIEHLEGGEAGDVGGCTLAGNAHQLAMHQMFAVEGEGQQTQDGPPHQQLKRGIWYQERALHTCTVFDRCPYILVCQLPAPH